MQKFNGSLVRQFPSLVTGNAAAGVGVTVFVSGTSALASLFEDDGVTAKSNPLTTDPVGFYSFKAADGKYRLQFSNGFPSIEVQAIDAVQLRADFDAIEASNASFLAAQQAAYDAFVLSQGWTQVGTFAAGFTFTSPNQVGQDASGNWWRWNGTLPKTVTAGTLPTSDANYKLVGDGVLRSDLAATDSTVLVGGVEAGKVGGRVSKFVTPQEYAGTDREKLIAALTSGFNVDLRDFAYSFSEAASVSVPANLIVKGDGAILTYSGAHIETALQLNFSGKGKPMLSGFTVNGSKLCNKVFEIRNLSAMATASTLFVSGVSITGAKRINTLSGGDGLRIVGAFDKVTLKDVSASNCELPAGQGTAGVIGVSGIAVDYSASLYCRKVIADGVNVEKIYSSDLSYQDDQDGLQYFAPFVSGSTTEKLQSTLIVKGGSTFTNCYGRSVKTQCRTTIVKDSEFIRNEGFASGVGNPEIDAQYGTLFESNNDYDYSNGQIPSACVAGSSGIASDASGFHSEDSVVHLGAGTALQFFAATFPRGNTHAMHSIDNVKVLGTCTGLLNLLCNSENNQAAVTGCYVQELATGETGERNLIYVRTSGSDSPFGATVSVQRCVYAGAHSPAILRDFIAGNAMIASVDAQYNTGFIDNKTSLPDNEGQKLNQASRINAVKSGVDLGGFTWQRAYLVANGATESIAINHAQGAQVEISARYNKDGWANISSSPTANDVINKGSAFEVGNTSEPATGDFRVWSSSSGVLAVKNNSGSGRYILVKVTTP